MSDYVQQSFVGGMNLLANDTRIEPNQYRIGFNLRNRYDSLDPIHSSTRDTAAPTGIKQELVTFGNYLILFVAGQAYYRYYTSTGWKQIVGFQMSSTTPRLWTVPVPLATTLYGRIAEPLDSTLTTTASVSLPIRISGVAGAYAGNVPGLLVQDNINQPLFIYIDPSTLLPVVRKTQDYSEWTVTYDADFNLTLDKREYVPIGNTMAWVDGILYVASQDGSTIYRSVSGRPLDFVVNIDVAGDKGGDAATTAYDVGVGGITCLRAMSNNALFVAASNANFLVTKNMTQNAPKIFGEYTFIKTFLFNATCISDRVILDSLGDTKFVDLTGVRSFNAIQQTQNEGRNSAFTATIQSAFSGIVQNPSLSAAILYDNYEFYGVNTTFGPAIVVYDTINGCWTSFDINQTGGKRIKILAKIELTIQRLYAITEDDQLYTLYSATTYDSPKVRPISASANLVKDERGYSVGIKGEVKLTNVRMVLDKMTEDTTVYATPYVNNRLTQVPRTPKTLRYVPPTTLSTELGDDVNTQLSNVLFSFPDCGQGWKTFCLLEWSGSAVVTQFTYTFTDTTPMNPPLTQSVSP